MENLPPKYVSPPGTWKTKAGLRGSSLVCLVVVAGLLGSLATNDRLSVTLTVVVLVPPLVAVFIWNVAELICILKRGGNRGIHPGAIVAIDLIIWLGWGLVDLYLIGSGITTRARYMIEDYSGYDGYRYRYDPSKVNDEDKTLEQEVVAKGQAMVAFATLLVIFHFVLFVMACYETNIRNRMPRTVYVMQPVYGPPPVIPGGYQQLGSLPGQPQVQIQPGQPMPAYLQVAPNQLPAQPAPTLAPESKSAVGAERFA
ncbi:hypothetical protein VTI74DRAFT_7166 [Chaetomium olivicolor]